MTSLNLNIDSLYKTGQLANIEAGAEAERAKVGSFRVGTTGMMDESGKLIGPCAARAYLRSIGVDLDVLSAASEARQQTELMFEAGRMNESIWKNNLLAGLKRTGLGDRVRILCEEDIPTSWVTDQGMPVIGRPDMILQVDGKSEIGIEHKLVSSVWKAKSYKFNRNPSLDHLLQAGHYAWQLDIPFELWYTNRTNYAVMGEWMPSLFPRYGEYGSEDCDYSFWENLTDGRRVELDEIDYRNFLAVLKATGDNLWLQVTKVNKKTQASETRWAPKYEATIKAVKPFRQGYNLRWVEETLQIKSVQEPEEKFIATAITITRLKRYYEFLSELQEYGKVPNESANMKADGKLENWKASSYCELRKYGLCCAQKKGMDLQQWIEDVRKVYTNKTTLVVDSTGKES